MGVPALFRWLSQKYPKIVSPVIEELPQEVDGVTIPVDTTKPNPNGEMDNLYLDMNGIVHPCSHPEDRPAPETEEEMMMAVFEYTDRVVNMVRPRKILMIAVDGVAPRAKMNQQRSRRFRSAKEAQEKEDDTAALMILLEKQRGHKIDEELKGKKVWDSNAITPGTPFMDILAASLRYWCQYKLNTDPAWAKLKVIISDSTVPGEGEHKIMEFIRSQRGNPEHDPNTRHVIYGLDADLIMLGLGTHEPHFRVLREDVFAADKKQKGCQICGQTGHRAEECQGKAKEKSGEFDEKAATVNISKKPFIWLHVGILREYLAVELDVKDQGFRFDLERAIDDWVFMCFFVGNDFLPHLPSLEIRDGGIDTLMAIWKDNLPVMGGYLTKDGSVELDKVQYILDGLAKQEDAIFRRRKQGEDRREENAKRRKLQEQGRNGRANTNDRPGYEDAVMSAPSNRRKVPDSAPPPMIPLMKPGDLSAETKKLNYDMVMNREGIRKANLQNKSAAAVLKAQLASGKLDVAAESPVNGAETDTEPGTPADGEAAVASVTPAKRKADEVEAEDATPEAKKDAEMPPDTVRLWEPGYRDRYYEQKFHVNADDHEFRHKVAAAYVEGLCWVLRYYFQGCPSWDWYYPYHYAPFAQDFKDVGKLDIKFTHGTIFKPFEQLMGVLPAASKHTLPTPFHKLMTDENSEIIEFYPENFPIDLNGKKFAWQGVALLPFIDEKRLLAAIQKVYPQLTPEDLARNELGRDTLLISDGHPLYDDVVNRFYSKKADVTKYKISMRTSEGLAGIVEKDPSFIPRSTLTFPLATGGMPDLDNDRTMSLFYDLPKTKNIHKSMLLRGVRLDPPTLNRGDIEMTRARAEGRGRSYGGAQLYRGRGNHNGSFRSDRGGHGGYNNNRGDDRGDNRGGNWGNNNNYNNKNYNNNNYNNNNYNNNNRNQGGYPAHQDGTIPTPSTGGWGGSWGGPPQGGAYGIPPPPGQFGRGGYPQPPPGVRDGGSYVGPPPGQGDNRRGGGYNNNRGGRGGNQNRNRGNGGQGGGYDGYGWSGKSY